MAAVVGGQFVLGGNRCQVSPIKLNEETRQPPPAVRPEFEFALILAKLGPHLSK